MDRCDANLRENDTTFYVKFTPDPTPGAGGRPQGCCGLNARAAAPDLLVEALIRHASCSNLSRSNLSIACNCS